ncbi:MAG: ABC transporter ATP-binding protein [Blautia sp.]|nr:ABC transporter ATP-binding protein [Blautia sp.]
MKLLECTDVSVHYRNYYVLKNASFSLEEGQWLMIVGPNGAGKSTIVNAISQGVAYDGKISYLGKDIRKYRPMELAKNIGVLAQNHFVGYSFKVKEVVRLGRYAYARGFFHGDTGESEEQIERALEMTGMEALAEKSVLELSGGELQRVFLAQLFAQNPRILILDEPTNHLDLVYQQQTFALLGNWLKEKGRAVISVVHDLSLAKAYGTDGILLKDGQVTAKGKIEEVFAPANLEYAFSTDVHGWMRKMLRQWE